jgi:threonine aldolase
MTYKYSFLNDYTEGAHPAILALMQETNSTLQVGYGADELTSQAIALIQKEIGNQNAAVHFVSGGTQANLIALASMLRPYESVIAAETAHICVHEAGAIEATGHKIHSVQSIDGKIKVSDIQTVLASHTDEHMVKPKVVFMTQSTETGTIYTRTELESIFNFCKKNSLYVYIDGARLGSALAIQEAGMSLSDIAQLSDMFYIGGTKNGALLGEALVICNPELQSNFRFHLKQRGALLAKGRLIATQFLALFQDNLYIENAKHANDNAAFLTRGIKSLGYTFLTDSVTNQIFPIFSKNIIEQLQKNYGFYVWSKVDEDHSSIRLVTSWATTRDSVESFLADLKLISEK